MKARLRRIRAALAWMTATIPARAGRGDIVIVRPPAQFDWTRDREFMKALRDDCEQLTKTTGVLFVVMPREYDVKVARRGSAVRSRR
jgi:hypothetical protein